ncbi:hypothetical protein Tco_1088245, partial [Tanacetum coccineum]
HDYDFCIDDDDDVKEINPYLEKKKKLILESKDYQQTLLFMDKLKVIAGQEQVSSKDLGILFHAYNMIMGGVLCFLHVPIVYISHKTFVLQFLTDRKRVSSQSEMKTTNKSKLGSLDGEFWSDADFDFVYRDNNERIKKQEDNFADSKDIGKGIEIQHASTTDESSEDDFFGQWEPKLVAIANLNILVMLLFLNADS